MRATAKYYVEMKDPGTGKWLLDGVAASYSGARAFATFWPNLSPRRGNIRIRHKGRIIGQWREGRKVTT